MFHFAAAKMRHDQELACDADVLAAHPQQRRRYGDALLNTQLALQTAPLGCHFGFGHPLKERIVMLRQMNVSAARRNSGIAMVALLCCGMAFAAWAAQPQAEQPQAATSATRVANLQPGTVDAQSRMAAPPHYPEQSLKDSSTGVVVLVVDLKADGAVVGVRVEKSSGHAELDQAAMGAAVKWRFHPAMEAGRGAASQVRVPVEFKMDEPDGKAAG
jgi:TonB family protein